MQITIPGKGTLQGTAIHGLYPPQVVCQRFSGVPYALPPVGNRRWMKPVQLPLSFSYGTELTPGVFDKPCSACPQVLRRNRSQVTDEDCLQLNIYVPTSKRPDGGWPVFFHIHGGFLQNGSNSTDSLQHLLSTDVKCVIVSPNYRLGIFGFLASREICATQFSNSSMEANFGFWDQRLALEWTYENISAFGGNPENITVGGLSAGAYATFHQLAHDIGPHSTRQIIRRVVQWSNGCGVQPKTVNEAQLQFDDLISVLGIPRSWSDKRKLEALRQKTADELIAGVGMMKMKFIRPVLDGNFMAENLFPSLFNGTFGQRMKELGIRILIGDLTQEWHLYKTIYPPSSFEALIDRLSWDYPRQTAMAVCERYRYYPKNSDWINIFGKLYADLQIHCTMRGFLRCIGDHVPLDHIHRYRIDWRTKSVDKRYLKEVGASHGSDGSIWVFGNGEELTSSERTLIQEWLKPFGQFLRGENVIWGTRRLNEVKYLTSEGKIEIREDELWKTQQPLWDLVKSVTKMEEKVDRAKI